MIVVRGLTKNYYLGKITVNALRGVDITLNKGDFIVVAGPSGSGKTTLLNILGGLDRPDSGEVIVDGQDITKLDERELGFYRKRKVGFIFQSFNLLPILNVYENIDYALFLKGETKNTRKKILKILDAVGLSEYQNHKPNELSGGQRQRVAIARALIARPEIVIADEPTANLDSMTGNSIIDLMLEFNRNNGTTFVIATHDPMVMRHTDKIINMNDGRIVNNFSTEG
ncbi:MAG: ABC transporter ATP-binding protein [Thermodesulfovibrionales bacterium]